MSKQSELDEILDDFGSEAIDACLIARRSRATAGLSLGQSLYKAKQAILDLQNKQIEEVLGGIIEWYTSAKVQPYAGAVIDRIEAERNKLKESKDE